MKNYDAIIIGFGKGGKTLASDLGKRGWNVALVERSAQMYGGTCINIACIPTKALIHSAKIAGYRPLQDFGQKSEEFRKAIGQKNEITAFLRKKNFDNLNNNPQVDLYTGEAAFRSDKVIEVKTEKETLLLTAEKIFINTGAETVIPPIEGIEETENVYTSTSIMELKRLPERLVIIGGGYIGLEFASMFAGFGSRVTVLESYPHLLSREDPDIAEAVRSTLEKKGIVFRVNTQVLSVKNAGDRVSVNCRDAAKGEEYAVEAEALLVATGRRPATSSLRLETTGIKTDKHGAIVVNEKLQTSVAGVWALGDVKGGLQFTYISLDDYRIIREQLFGENDRTVSDRQPVAYSVFIDPPLSRIGLTEKEARAQGYEVLVKKIDVATIPRARVLGGTEGVLKSVVDAADGKILGCSLFCVDSEEVINTVSVAIKAELDYTFLRDQIYTHPTMSESLNDLFTF